MRPISLAERINRTGILFNPLQADFGCMPIAELCHFMAEELGQTDYLDYLEMLKLSYGADMVATMNVKHAMRKANHVLWDHEFSGDFATKLELQRAERTLYMLLVRPFLTLEQQENNKNN